MSVRAFGGEATRMREMFDRVAWRYDLVNRVLSAGTDRRWRSAVAEEVVQDHPALVLDACSGTGDQALAIARHPAFTGKIVCSDISWEMLQRGKMKMLRTNIPSRSWSPLRTHSASLAQGPSAIEAAVSLRRTRSMGARSFSTSRAKEYLFATYVLSDVHELVFRENTFDCATVCFGVRNFEDLTGGLGELHRVLRLGGKLIILEFSKPQNRVAGKMYGWYLSSLLPAMGGMLSGQGDAYRYLASSIKGFLTPPELTHHLEESGFVQVKHRLMTSGIVALTTAVKKKER